jgi:hypothetical protein
VVGQTEEAKDRKVPIINYNETYFMDFIKYVQPCLKAFVLHNYLAHWQDVQFKQLDQLPIDAILTCVDFSENITTKCILVHYGFH